MALAENQAVPQWVHGRGPAKDHALLQRLDPDVVARLQFRALYLEQHTGGPGTRRDLDGRIQQHLAARLDLQRAPSVTVARVADEIRALAAPGSLPAATFPGDRLAVTGSDFRRQARDQRAIRQRQ